MVGKRNAKSITGAIKARQREGREKRRHVVTYPTKLPGAARVLELIEDKTLRWYALLIVPQKEAIAQELLARKGLMTYCPMDFKWRKPNKYAVEQDLFSFPMMPGWVFVGMPATAAPWHEVVKLKIVRAVIGHDGWPMQIPQDAMVKMVTRFRNGVVRADERDELRLKKVLKKGDVVKIMEGPLRSFPVEIVELNGSVARVMSKLLGMSKPVDVPVDILEPAA